MPPSQTPSSHDTTAAAGDVRTGLTVPALRQAIRDNLIFLQGRRPESATRNDWYMALAYAVRDRLVARWTATADRIRQRDTRVVSYLSAEFLTGPHLENGLHALGIHATAHEACAALGQRLDDLIAQEEEPGLGNGGLGRLAACFLDSLATLEVLAIGYGIRYEFGIFDQRIQDGWQVEITDTWLHLGNPWEIGRPELACTVGFGGTTQPYTDERGHYRVRWVPARFVRGIPFDTPIPGFRIPTCDILRLWKAEACESFDLAAFNTGDHYAAVEDKVVSENLTKVLYPNDEAPQGKALRLEQQYFFVSCALQDMIRIHLAAGHPIDTFHELFAVQLNDTHPSIAVAELMRLLIDEHRVDWDAAWAVTRRTCAYTNHTLLPEALEKWPLPLFAALLPRHLEIIYEINRRFLDDVRRRYPSDEPRVVRMSLIDETGPRYVRMGHLATVGSHTVNGVAALHTELLTRGVLRDFAELQPDQFRNITNGVTPRRWMLLSNPSLARLISDTIGDAWTRDLERELPHLEAHASDPSFQDAWRQVKAANKRALAALVRKDTGIAIDPETLFDVQVKRIHEYKRQHLNILHVIALYQRLKQQPRAPFTPRTFLFGGKAAPGYFMAKLIIKLINSVAEVLNADPDVAGRLTVAFLPDFNVTLGQRIYPAADLSEQISTAGKEASGTGNMKFALNGALTIGTLDGANVEMRQAVGADNFFLFGLTAQEVSDLKGRGYSPRAHYESNATLRGVIDLIAAGTFSGGDRGLFQPLVDALLTRDDYLLLADFQSYVDTQKRVSAAFADPTQWTRMAILNVARMGRFSSDRAIREYCEAIWHVRPAAVSVDAPA